MQPEDQDRTLWALTELEDPADAGAEPEPIPDELLVAYRRGELPAAQRRQVEAALMASPAHRQRLQELADVGLPTPPASPREELLQRFGQPVGPSERGRRGRRRWQRWGLVAASLAVAALTLVFLRPAAPPPVYDVGISALQEQRQGGDAGAEASAFADSLVTVTAVVRGRAEADVRSGLYREDGGELRRIPEDPRIERLERRGLIQLQAPAEALVGPEPGTYRIFLVIARDVDLPGTLPLPSTAPTADGSIVRGRRRLHRLTLHLRTATPSTPDAGREPREEEDHEAHPSIDPAALSRLVAREPAGSGEPRDLLGALSGRLRPSR